MNHLKVRKSYLKGQITVPPSKSQTLRAILFATLAEGESRIEGFLPSPDAFAMIQACKLLGAKIYQVGPSSLIVVGIDGKIGSEAAIIDAGNSGIVLRFITAIAALGKEPVKIIGDRSIMSQRPMQPLLNSLKELGARAVSSAGNGFAPLLVQGPLKGGKTTIEGQDSQFVSALLIAGSFCQNPIEIHVLEPGEKPWIDLTLNWLTKHHLVFTRDLYDHFQLPGKSALAPFTYQVPGDFSSAAFPTIAALITDSILTIHNLDFDDPQGDKELIYILKAMGANIDIFNHSLIVTPHAPLTGRVVDINDFIDSICALTVMACFSKGTTQLKNASVARTKECNRIACLVQELTKMGAKIKETSDGLLIEGGSLHGATVNSHGDHRMAMALAIAALGAEGETLIEDVSCIAKTYPTFIKDFQDLGADMEEIH